MRDSFYWTITHSPQWKAWQQEQVKRLKNHIRNNSRKFTGCYDMPEVMECGLISQEHFQDFLKFVKDGEMLEDYEEGTLDIKVRKHWYQFWLPKYVSYGYYWKIGNKVQVTLQPNIFAGLQLQGEIIGLWS